MPAWTPDIEIDETLARRLIETRWPELAPVSLRFLGEGWDNQAYLVNGTYVFRIPHRKLGGDLMANECLVLPLLGAAELPLAVPQLQFLAPVLADFPHTIAGYPLIPGRTGDSVEWTVETRAKDAPALGAFLRRLHHISEGKFGAKADELRRADLSYRLPIVLGKLASAPRALTDLLSDLASTEPWHADPVWVHGDLYARHLIIDDTDNVTGVIDWGDVHVGDPALDLAIAWMFLPRVSWPDFFGAYGEVDEPTWRRAQFRAITHWAYLQEYAQEKQDEDLRREGEFLLQNLLPELRI